MPKKMIRSLTPEQEARFPEFVRKWIKIGLSAQPADRGRAERAIAGLYRLAKLKEPRVIWLPCPISAALSTLVYTTLRARGFVGRAVRSAVVSAVVSAVDSAVDSAVYARYGGSLWPAYAAWADYFNEVLGVSIDRNYLDLVESCGYYWLLDDVCFASERPREINLDDRGRLHGERGHSISYPSGWGLWHWHGVRVPGYVIERPDEITVQRIDDAENAETRRVMIERYRHTEEVRGAARYLIDAGARRLDHDEAFGTLHFRELPDGDEPIVILEVVNRSREPDGSFKHYHLRVPPTMRKSQHAWNWLNGYRADFSPTVIQS